MILTCIRATAFSRSRLLVVSTRRGNNNCLSFRRRDAFYHERRQNNKNHSNGFVFGIPPYIWILAGGTTVTVGYFYFSYLDEVPLTKRKRWIATSPEWERKMGDREYKQLLQTFRKDILPSDHRASTTVRRVGSRIAKAANQFAIDHNIATEAELTKQQPYTYTVVRDDMANAFVLPNNHVFVMTGLFRFVKDEDDLAAVLGHEMAHNLARHVGEKISGTVVVNMLARLTLLFDPSGALFSILVPATTLFRSLPHSRTQESEADRIGVHLAAVACYDPRAAKRVFKAMKDHAQTDGSSPPEFLSTHPSHETRISNFDNWMPQAMDTFTSDSGNRCRFVRKEMEMARQVAVKQAIIREKAAR